MASQIDKEVRQLIAGAYERTRALLIQHRDALQIVAKTLLEKEVIFKDDLKTLIGPRPFADPSEAEVKVSIEKTPEAPAAPIEPSAEAKPNVEETPKSQIPDLPPPPAAE
jgi:AFG3 family protein